MEDIMIVELFDTIVGCWQNVDHSILHNILSSIQRRRIQVYQKNRSRKSY